VNREIAQDRSGPRTVTSRHWLTAATRRGVHRILGSLEHGHLVMVENGQEQRYGNPDAPLGMRAHVEILDPGCFVDIAVGGTIGVAESYMAGKFECDDLTALVRIFVRNQSVMERMEGGATRLLMPVLRLAHHLNRNTRRGSRRNIAAHYDLGNEFFELFLDPTMMYSSAIYPHPEADLNEAAVHKLDVICRKLQLKPQDHLLEIGTGWGGLAVHAARHYGCRVTTTTISAEQHRMASARAVAAGLGDRIEVLRSDYRELNGQYDKLVSVEMFEAVGYRFFDTFFDQCARLMKPSGEMLLQTITIADQRFETARRSVDFIQRYIFPGGCLPSVAAIAGSVARATDLRIVGLEDIGPHYARTLGDWRERFRSRQDEVRSLGFPESFLRMWDWYLSYCEGGFHERAISNVQLVMARPENRRALPVVS
jgi:cyclopropane-fatty-acyl-phospholipid synthase